MSVKPYILRKPPTPKGDQLVFASKFGWAVHNRFSTGGFEVLYEIPRLDAILFEHGHTPYGEETAEFESVWGKLIAEHNELAICPDTRLFSSVVLAAETKEPEDGEENPNPTPEPSKTPGSDASDETTSKDGSDEPVPESGNASDESGDSTEPEQTEGGESGDESTTGEPAKKSEYTLEQLMDLHMDDLREIGDLYGVKNVSKAGLAKEILDAIENGVTPKVS